MVKPQGSPTGPLTTLAPSSLISRFSAKLWGLPHNRIAFSGCWILFAGAWYSFPEI